MTAVSKSIHFFALSVLSLAISFTLDAQELRKVPRIGILEPATAAAVSPRVEAFRQGLRALGYTEGQNIAIEYRYANGKPESLPDFG
jgi:putative ABC transport system substrate-binding protein